MIPSPLARLKLPLGIQNLAKLRQQDCYYVDKTGLAIDLRVLLTVVLFWRVRPLAAALLLPYLAWVLFATLLNWQFLEANPGADGPLGGGEAVQTVEFK